MTLRTTGLLALVAAVALPATAFADVYLNGVNITGVTNQTFEKATVHIDAQGNVHIKAAGYAVSGASTGGDHAASSQSAAPASHYYLVTSHASPGATQYDIDVYVNAKWIRKLRSDEDQIVTDITRYLHSGSNKVLLVASKHIEGERKSHSPSMFFRVILGAGNEGGNNVMIDDPLIDFKVTADEVQDVSKEFTIQVK